MGYAHIENLYANQEVLIFKQVYCLEKIHGTSAHISWKKREDSHELRFFSGGCSHESFKNLFDEEALKTKLVDIDRVVIYGEAYGGKIQKMSGVYGKELKFVAFDVEMDTHFLSVPQASEFVKDLGLEFVYFELVEATVEKLNELRDRDSDQAIRNGLGPGIKGEGIVIRPAFEATKNNGERICAKHKRDEFRETKSPRVVDDPSKLLVLEEAEAIANEWVVEERLSHILDKIPNHRVENIPAILSNMVEDVLREGSKEIVWSREVEKAIRTKTAKMYLKRLKEISQKQPTT